MRRCIHFRGVQRVCGAGIDPMSVRDAAGAGMYRWPCLDTGRTCLTSCDKQRMMTPEEEAEETVRIMAAVEKFEADLASGKCPHCGAAIEATKVAGRCEYAEPCGHRLGQVGSDDV